MKALETERTAILWYMVIWLSSIALVTVVPLQGFSQEASKETPNVTERVGEERGASVSLGATKGWRFQFSGDYTRVQGGGYDFDSDSLPYKVSGERDGDVFGGTFSLGAPKWKETSWFDFSYRSGELTGHNDYEQGGFPDVRSSIRADLTEVEVKFRTSLKDFVGGVSFLYQNWDTRERFAAGASSYDDTFYLVNFDFGPGWLWTFENGIGLGIKTDIGVGIGYASLGRPDVLGDGILLDAFGSGSGFLQWAIKGRGYGAKLFLEAGIKGSLYYAAHSENDESELWESQLWHYYGPFAKAGIRLDF